MSKSFTSEHPGSKEKTGATGPRTGCGKAKASENARTHGIFAGRILAEEKEIAAVLYEGFRRELRPQGALEFEIIGDLVLNRLRKRRIDKYAKHEIQKAVMCASRSRLENYERRQTKAWLRIGNPETAALEADCDCLPPERCVEFLTGLTDKIGERGVKPDEDLALVAFIYGKQLTATAALIMTHLKRIKMTEHQRAEGGEKSGPEQRKDQELVLKGIAAEIEIQKARIEVERTWDEMQYAADAPVLPSDPILDRIERYRAGIEREFRRCLENLESIRRLRGDT